ncbi:DUF5335 family protein [Fontivita pretiosa]|uniref:DUF5335 family protein n=1 Tax=Fontivita pretiosa TaxID=2989684 RepID=UPI003D182862
MQTQEIPMEQWTVFFNGMSRQHEGEPVTIEVQGPEVGSRAMVKHVPFMGIAFDPKDSVGEEIEVFVSLAQDQSGPQPGPHLMHAINHPSRVQVVRLDDGSELSLQIETPDGPATVVRFEPAPESRNKQVDRHRPMMRHDPQVMLIAAR